MDTRPLGHRADQAVDLVPAHLEQHSVRIFLDAMLTQFFSQLAADKYEARLLPFPEDGQLHLWIIGDPVVSISDITPAQAAELTYPQASRVEQLEHQALLPVRFEVDHAGDFSLGEDALGQLILHPGESNGPGRVCREMPLLDEEFEEAFRGGQLPGLDRAGQMGYGRRHTSKASLLL